MDLPLRSIAAVRQREIGSRGACRRARNARHKMLIRVFLGWLRGESRHCKWYQFLLFRKKMPNVQAASARASLVSGRIIYSFSVEADSCFMVRVPVNPTEYKVCHCAGTRN